MAKINRYDGNVVAFGSEAIGTERTVFGDTTQSDSLDQNLNSFYRRGFGIVDVNEAPTKQDFNAVNFTNSQLIAYLHQVGVPEWNSSQEYHIDSFANRNGELYISQSDNNIGNDPETDSINWVIYSNNFVKKTGNETIDGIKTFSSPISGNITGNSATATKLATARTINGVPFDGTANITISDNTAVKKVGNETIDGIKTFTESPTVPTPTTDYQSVPLRSSNITVDVGSGQTYTTINQALEYLSGFYPVYKNSGVTATINLKAGFVMQEQVLVRGIDLGWITITGEDAETVIDNNALTVNFTIGDYGINSYPAFGVSKGGTLPRIGQLFSFNVAGVGGNKHGVMAIGAGSSAEITASKGVKNVGTYGIYAYQGSTINAESADASGAGTYGILAARGSTINAESADASGAGTYGILAYRGSTINATLADASGAGSYGIYASQDSTINAYSADATGAGTYGIFAHRGSTINAESADASGAGSYGIYANNSSTVNANSANASSAGNSGIVASNGSTINAASADATGSGTFGIYTALGSTINAYVATGTLNQTANTLTNHGIIYK